MQVVARRGISLYSRLAADLEEVSDGFGFFNLHQHLVWAQLSVNRDVVGVLKLLNRFVKWLVFHHCNSYKERHTYKPVASGGDR